VSVKGESKRSVTASRASRGGRARWARPPAPRLRAIAEDRVRIIRANESGIALDVIAPRPDPATLNRPTYRALVYVEGAGITRHCTCPAVRRCNHIEAAELLWRPVPSNSDAAGAAKGRGTR